MGDRTNPIKFGPEWLRNISRERAVTGSGSAPPAATAPPGMTGSRTTPNNNSTNTAPRILLARLRYGREEMLALYDRQTAEAPAQLKSNDTLYQPRGKPPYALNTFEEDSRDNVNRQSMSGGLLNPSERYAGRGRGQPSIENKNVIQPRGGELRTGRARGYMRSTSAPRGWNSNRVGYNGIPDDEPTQPLRSWNNNNANQSGLRPNNGEPPEWQNKPAQYRPKRQTNTNWRQQHGREDGEEWRATDGARRPQDKWAEWGWQQEPSGRPTQDKQWHSNRRTWVAGDTNEDSLPEWAVDNAEACGGTFDSSGAFHGYSNDDSNLPKNQETPYPLTKSHTHGSFSRSKMAEEGSEEWWASEKAKKLSPKRFDTADIKKVRYADGDIKKPLSADAPGQPNWSSGTSKAGNSNDSNRNTGAIPKRAPQFATKGSDKLQDQQDETTSKQDKDNTETQPKPEATTNLEEKAKTDDGNKEMPYESRFEAEKQNETGNIQSVIITSNNSLRQKHQNIAVTPTETPKRRPKLMRYYEKNPELDNERDIGEFDVTKGADSDKIVEDILQMSLDDGIPSATINQLLTSHSGSTMNSYAQIPYPSMQTRMPCGLQGLGLSQTAPMQTQDAYNGMMGQPLGITNSMLNASLGLPVPNNGSGISPSMSNPGLQSNVGLGLQGVVGSGMQQPAGGVPRAALPPHHIQGFGVQPNSMQNHMAMADNMQLTNSGHNLHNPKIPVVHPLDPIEKEYVNMRMRHIAYNKVYGGNVMNQPPPPINNLGLQQAISPDQWYYEDPNNIIQGPFSSQDMYSWFRAGFFRPELMVRRSCETNMRPLGTYGPMPFGPMDLLSAFPLGGGYDMASQQPLDAASQPGLGANVQSLWGQPANNAPAPTSDSLWLPNSMNKAANSFSANFWNNQSSEMAVSSLRPENMKTEDEILAQMRAAQAQSQGPRPASPLSFFAEPPQDADANLNMNHLQKLIQKDAATTPAAAALDDASQPAQAPEQPAKADASEVPSAKPNKSEKTADVKPAKEVKKQKSKETVATAKSKKTKDEKKEEIIETKLKDEEVKVEKRSAEPSPSAKNKKEDKSSKKELDKEKKEWIKEGFTIVKGAEKTKDKDGKKKAEEVKAAEEVERKKKEDDKLASEEKKRLQETKKQQAESQNQPTSRQATESVSKKAPWSAASQAAPSSRDGPTLAEIQRLEREKKLEQMKEQQQMMQIIAQQQAAALAREQEVQTGLGWAKKPSSAQTGPTLAEIQAEARKHAAVAAAAAPREEAQPTPPPAPLPWVNIHNGGDGYISAGFWDSPQPEPVKPAPKQPEPKADSKNKKKVTVMAPPKRENSPSMEFDLWCANMLVSWSDTGIDVPTFVSFLRDIESPYEVKDYVKCYLGDTREANDFARQFLEKRSRLMRVGMVTPSDDLCSPAVAVNPRTNSTSDHADLKAKGKKTKKNKMFKVDARNILGFSVTASEDRINVGDIDTV